MLLLAAAGLLAAIAVAANGGATPDPAGHLAKRRAVLMPVGAGQPFRVRGSNFLPRERVRVTITPTGRAGITRRIRATGRGTFVLAFPGVRACGGVRGAATGTRGSRASFQFSSFTCPRRRPPY